MGNNLKPYKRRGDVLHTVSQGQALLLEPNSGAYFSLNETGAFIWECLEESQAAIDIVEKLMKEFEVDFAAAELDVNAFLNEMNSQSLLDSGE